MAKKKKLNVLQSIDQMIGEDADLRAMIDEEILNAEVASLIYEARTAAGLTQQQLAKLVGTTQPNIARLEDTSYEGHSLTMLQKIASELHRRLELRFVSTLGDTHAA